MRTSHVRYRTMWTIGVSLIVVAAFAAVGCNAEPRDGVGGTATTIRPDGAEPAPEKIPTVGTGAVTETKLGQMVAVEALVSHQCPARGCWLRVKDDTGEVMVDLSPNKLELSEDRVGQKAMVTGKVVKKSGKFWIEAQKVEFKPAGK